MLVMSIADIGFQADMSGFTEEGRSSNMDSKLVTDSTFHELSTFQSFGVDIFANMKDRSVAPDVSQCWRLVSVTESVDPWNILL